MSFFFGVDTIHGVRKTTCNALIIRLKLRHRFPHLYGCGHIEGNLTHALRVCVRLNFRIFMDAATLKGERYGQQIHAHKRFPHLYGCGHISASLWMRPH